MNLAALDLNLLVALDCLLEEASVGRAAERLAISQPAMSHALKRLRTLLGDPLLVRVGSRMQLTPRAEGLRDPLRDALAQVRDVLASDTFNPANSRRTFRLFVGDNATDLLLPSLWKCLEKEAPHVSIRLQSGGLSRLDPFQLGAAVDAVVTCHPNLFKGFYQRKLFTDRDACALRTTNPIKQRLADRDVFLKAKHVAVVGTELTEDPVDTWLHEEGYERNVAVTVPYYVQALHMVATSDLIAVIPERLVRAYTSTLPLDVMPVPLNVGTFNEYLLHPARSHSDPGCVWLRTILTKIGCILPL